MDRIDGSHVDHREFWDIPDREARNRNWSFGQDDGIGSYGNAPLALVAILDRRVRP